MISIREMTAADEGAVMEMVDRFYHSPAVEHEVDPAVLRRSFQAAVDPAEPLILAPECRGKGYGEQVIRWAMEQHPECARYRLEVTGENRAARLYERMGFRYLDYKQMVIDR